MTSQDTPDLSQLTIDHAYDYLFGTSLLFDQGEGQWTEFLWCSDPVADYLGELKPEEVNIDATVFLHDHVVVYVVYGVGQPFEESVCVGIVRLSSRSSDSLGVLRIVPFAPGHQTLMAFVEITLNLGPEDASFVSCGDIDGRLTGSPRDNCDGRACRRTEKRDEHKTECRHRQDGGPKYERVFHVRTLSAVAA